MTIEHTDNTLTAAQREVLAIISEEAGEVVQAAGKLFRHGKSATDHSQTPPHVYDNMDGLLVELADVLLAVALAAKVGLLPDAQDLEDRLNNHMELKIPRLRQLLHCPFLVAALDDVVDEMFGDVHVVDFGEERN